MDIEQFVITFIAIFSEKSNGQFLITFIAIFSEKTIDSLYLHNFFSKEAIVFTLLF